MQDMRGMNDMPPVQVNAVDTEKIERIIYLLEAVSGSLIEITWIFKTIFVMFIIFTAWKLVRK